MQCRSIKLECIPISFRFLKRLHSILQSNNIGEEDGNLKYPSWYFIDNFVFLKSQNRIKIFQISAFLSYLLDISLSHVFRA